MDVHTRRLRIFIEVATQLHFGRAAQTLFIAQQAVSRQIQELEQQLGTPLFVRTSRTVELTPAGQAFLEAALDIVTVLDRGVAEATRLAESRSSTVTVGFRLGAALELTEQLLDAASTRESPIQVRFKEMGFEDLIDAFSRLSLDCAILRAPVDHDRFATLRLYDEPLVVAMSRRHPLAVKSSIKVEDLVNERVAVAESNSDDWTDYWSLRAVLPEAELVRATSQSEELQLVATGGACSFTIAGAARFAPHPAVAYIPLSGVEPCPTFLVWRRERVSPALASFVALATAVRDKAPEIVASIESPFV